MSTQTSSKKTPDIILDTAEALILARGFHGVSVETIIEQSGVSKGTFFYHFKSKDILAEILLQRFVDGVGEKIIALMDQVKAEDLGPYDTLIRFLSLYPNIARQMPGCLMAAFSYQLLQESPALTKIAQNTVDGWNAFFTPLVKAAFEEKKSLWTLMKVNWHSLYCVLWKALLYPCGSVIPMLWKHNLNTCADILNFSLCRPMTRQSQAQQYQTNYICP